MFIKEGCIHGEEPTVSTERSGTANSVPIMEPLQPLLAAVSVASLIHAVQVWSPNLKIKAGEHVPHLFFYISSRERALTIMKKEIETLSHPFRGDYWSKNFSVVHESH